MALPQADPLETRVLVLAPTGRDAGLAARVLEEAGMPTKTCPSVADLRQELLGGAGAIVLTEEALTPEGVDDLAEIFSTQLPWSDLPVLVFCATEARAETVAFTVRRLGEVANVTLLDRPTRKVTLVSAVQAALRARKRQYEVRDLLLELERGVRHRDQFLAMLGHELRNPLGAILASVQLMERRDEATFANERRVIQRQTRLLSRLVDDLLDVSRVTSGKITLERGPVDVHELVERCVQGQTVTALDRRIDLAFLSDGKPSVVKGDSVRLEQVVNNLLTNALKYTPPGGRVRVRLSTDETEAEIRVEDTGVGIDARVLPRVFELFTQAPSALDRSQGGLGIGLTLVRSLVSLHQGSVRAESPGLGAGSTFIVRLPLDRERPDAAAPAGLEPERGRSRRILLIEDNPDVREALQDLLDAAGHTVETAPDGISGIERALTREPEVALVDIGLPGLDGYEVARRIRQKLGSRILLVALTGYGLPNDRIRALESGFDAHLTKPISLDALLALLDRHPSEAEPPPDETDSRPESVVRFRRRE
jgi:signal transduction histidine kinase/FixJ family two-component response regulator